MAARQKRELKIASMLVPTRMRCVTLSGKGIEPQKVLTPDEGETITNWAKREAKYRRQKTASDTRSTGLEAKRSMKSEWTDGELPVRRPSERRYQMLQKWAKNGVFLVEPKDNGRVLVVTVTELASLTVDEAKRRPDKVQAAIQKTVDKPLKRRLRSRQRWRLCHDLLSMPEDRFPPDLILEFFRNQLAKRHLKNLWSRRKSKVPAHDYRQ